MNDSAMIFRTYDFPNEAARDRVVWALMRQSGVHAWIHETQAVIGIQARLSGTDTETATLALIAKEKGSLVEETGGEPTPGGIPAGENA